MKPERSRQQPPRPPRLEDAAQQRQKQRERSENAPQPPKNVVFVERPEARYRIIYEYHGRAHTPDVLGAIDALGLEAVTVGRMTKQNAETSSEVFWTKYQKRSFRGRSGSLEEVLVRESVPVYFIDIT